MEFNIKIGDPEENMWQKLGHNGIHRHASRDGVLYKYVSLETAMKIIEGKCLQYSLPHTFNDPFDMTCDLLDMSISELDLKQRIAEDFIGDEKIKNYISEYLISNPSIIPKEFENAFKNAKQEIGITCFSKSYKKTLMWSHYANKHNGLCLGFSFDQTNNEGVMQLSVGYSDKIQPISYFKETLLSVYNWLFTKSIVWEYEEEVRRTNFNKSGLIPFHGSDLKEIYFGVNVADNEINNLFSALNGDKELGIKKISRMRISAKKFDLMEENIFSTSS